MNPAGTNGVGWACRVLGVALLGSTFAACPVASQAGPDVDTCPALELLSIVHLLADNSFATQLDAPFVDEAREHFGPWARHPAVVGASSVFASGVRLDDLVAVLASASPPPKLAVPEAAFRTLPSHADSVLRGYLADLRDFAVKSRADAFLAQMAPSSEAVLLRERGPFLERMGAVADYLGWPLPTTVCLNRFFAAGHITWEATGDDEGGRVVVMIGPQETEGGSPLFHLAGRLDSDLLASLVGPSVARLARSSSSAVASYEALLDPIRYPLSRRGITGWQEAWVEHVVRAVALRLTWGDGGDARGKVEELRRSGFFYLGPLLQRLELYEAERRRYPDLASFYPVLVEALDREAALARSVVVDPRIELMTGVQVVAGWWLLTSYEFPYRRDLTEFLASASDDPAVDAYRRLANQGFRFEVVPRFFELLSPPPELELARPVPEEIVGRVGGSARPLDEFVERLREFARDTGFHDFLRAHSGTYHAIEVRNRRSVGTAVDSLWRYLGDAPAEWRVVLSPLMHDGGFAGHGEGSIPFAFVGPSGTADGLPDFGGPERLGPLVWHEFSHTVVNPLAERYADRVADLEFAFDPIREAMERQFYGSWSTALNEHIVRAIEVRLTARVIGPDEASEILAQYESLGFRYLEDLVEELGRYESARGEYPALADYYPRLLDRLETAAGEITPASGR